MGVMDKFLNYMKLNDMNEDEYYDDDDDEYYDEEPIVEKKAPVVKKASAANDESVEFERPVRKAVNNNKITQMRQVNTKRIPSDSTMQVCVKKPTTIEDAREITDTLLTNRTVVLNLEGIDMDVAQRIIDFTSGSCYAIGGNLQKISQFIFIITPASVDISGDFQDIFGGAFETPIGGLN